MTVSWALDGEACLSDAAVEALIGAAVAHGGRAGLELDVVFVGDQALAQLHAEWLADERPTDVIAFDLGAEGPGPAGELYVSVDCARRVAPTRPVPVERELALYVVHGALHLCGFDDEAPDARARMRRAEAEVLASLGYAPDPEPQW